MITSVEKQGDLTDKTISRGTKNQYSVDLYRYPIHPYQYILFQPSHKDRTVSMDITLNMLIMTDSNFITRCLSSASQEIADHPFTT